VFDVGIVEIWCFERKEGIRVLEKTLFGVRMWFCFRHVRLFIYLFINYYYYYYYYVGKVKMRLWNVKNQLL
jgi:hypothetical protein